MMTTVIYASILAMLMCWLSMKVIKARRKNRIKYADGDCDELKIARSAQSNAVDYIPITLILLFALEYNGGHLLLVHVIGIVFVIGRVVHCQSILADKLRGRVTGMKITFGVILILAVVNLVYLPYSELLP